MTLNLTLNDGSLDTAGGIPQVPFFFAEHAARHTHVSATPAVTSNSVVNVNAAPISGAAVATAAVATAASGYPDASNTGVPSGVTLQSPSAANLPQGVTVDSAGNITINTAGITLSGFNISGTVYINTSNVTLENCKVSTGGYDVVTIAKGLSGVTVQNCTINNLGGGGEGINGEGTFVANNIMGCVDGINVWGDNTVIKDNYIHGEAGPASAHFDTVQADGAFSNLTIEHNTLVNEQTQTSVLMLDNYWGPINNVTVNDNIMVGGGYTVYIDEVANGQAGGGKVTNVSFTNNHLGAGQYGTLDVRSELGDSPIISGNVNDGAALLAQLNSSGSTAPAAPTIASWSPDTGVVGDGITNVNTPTLKGSAAANSTVTVYDGATKIGVATADSTGSWSFTTAKLSDGTHVLTATDTNSAGVSAASTALGITVDTHAPAAPVETSDSVVNGNHVLISGTAEANSTIALHDGTTLVGTATTNASGNWSLTTSALLSGGHVLTATATDAAGTTSAASAAVDPVIGSTPPAAPAIASWSPDTGVVGDGVTNVNTPTLKGSAAASSTVTVYDGATKIGVTTADSTGAWSFTTSKLSDGTHVLTATDTNSTGVSAASKALGITVDTHVPTAPVETSDSVVNGNHVLISGTAEANSAIALHDGTTLVGTATTNASGNWSLTTSALSNGVHVLTATATDAAGTTSAASAAVDPVIGSTAQSVNFTGLTQSGNVASIAGAADANAHIQVDSNGTLVGTATSDSSGHWSINVGWLANSIHSFTAQEVNSAGHVIATSSGAAISGTSGNDILTSTGGNDLFFGNGGIDTFDFRAGFGHSIITDGGLDDHFTFSASEFTSFANLLSHATQVGADAVFSHGSDTLTLKSTKITDLHSADFHFA